TWRAQRREHGVIPTIGVNNKHAVAMRIHRPIDNITVEISNPGNGRNDFHPIIHCRKEPAISPSPRTPRYANSVRIDFRAAVEVVQGADGIPRFNSGWSISARIPPPSPKAE